MLKQNQILGEQKGYLIVFWWNLSYSFDWL